MRSPMHLAAAVLLLAAGCSPPGFLRQRVPARIVFPGEASQITTPDAVVRNQPFTATVVTFAGGCIQEQAGTKVSVQGLRAQIHPFHFRTQSEACTDDLVYMPQSVELRFSEPGVATIEVHGVSNELQFGGDPEWVVLQKQIVIR